MLTIAARIVPKGSVPARERNLRGLPPIDTGVGWLNLFVEQDLRFEERLIDAGVSTKLSLVPGAYHGFLCPRA
jgi:acetyl esterase/lipase